MYGRATDTPVYLAALLGSDKQSIKAALYHLNGAIVHQETVSPAAPFVTKILINNLANNDIADPTAYCGVIDWLQYLAESLQIVAISPEEAQIVADKELLAELASLSDDAAEEFLESEGLELWEQLMPSGYINTAKLTPEVIETLTLLPEASEALHAWKKVQVVHTN
ncbi:hypothetical protein CFREI_13465 [Corynebacterium freiburgense]|nr:hypothetical protein CFREI_13465 [Corynebacterium freiburgense]